MSVVLVGAVLPANALLALAAALLWGAGDYAGAMGVKSATPAGSTGSTVRAALNVVLLSHAASFVVLVAVARSRANAFPHGALLVWGLAAGIAGGLSLTCFYMALSRGAMGAAAAVSGLLAAAIPAALTIVSQGSPGALPVAGFALAGVAIWLIAAGPAAAGTAATLARTMLLAVIAGAGFGLYFIALKMAGAGGLLWPMATARMGSLSVCALILLGILLREHYTTEAPGPSPRGRPKQDYLQRKVVLWALATAVLDTSGNLLFIAATRAGRLDVAAVLASLYPATTIVLAAVALGERPTRRQVMGMGLAAVAVVAITI